MKKVKKEAEAGRPKASSAEKTPKIPGAFRKPLKKRRFGKLIKMLTDSGEIKILEAAFPEGADGRRRYKAPAEKKKAKEIAGILKKVRKARSGPRTVRLILVVILIGVPVIFSALFLDRTASRRLEGILEKQTGTDATVAGLDISIPKGSIRIGKLALASQSDPMIDEWVLENLAADIRLASLSFRRVIIDEVSAEFAMKVPRETSAVYPGKRAKESEEKKGGGLSFDTDLLPSVNLQFDSADLVPSLREDLEAEYKDLTDGLDDDIDEAREVGERAAELLGRSLPGKNDLAGWTALVTDGKNLAEDLKSQCEIIEEYRTRISRAAETAKEASEEARRAVEKDLAKIEDAVSFDRNTLNEWLGSAIGSYLGPKAEVIFNRINALRSPSGEETRESRTKRSEKGRMKSGRIVSFPVRLPPRFSIGKMHFSALGAELNGTNVGIDHDLAGAPSVLNLEISGMSGVEGSLAADLTVDGRSGADRIIDGKAESSGWAWSTGSGEDDLGGILEATADFFVNAENPDLFAASGKAVISNWSGRLSGGTVDIVSADSPPLAVEYELIIEKGVPLLKLSLAEGMFEGWSKALAESILPLGAEQAKAALLDAVGDDLDGLDEVLGNLNAESADLNDLGNLLDSQERKLEENLQDWTNKAAGGMDIPGTEDIAEKAAKGLKSLF